MKKEEKWEFKDRNYYLSNEMSPLTYTLASKHTRRFPLLWFDEEKGHNREIRYATNQRSIFVDEQDGMATLEHIVFENGALHVPKEKQNLQKLLSLYHPHRNKKYKELDVVKDATEDLDDLDAEFEALSMGSNVNSMSSKELKRDIMLFAKRNPYLFLELANDENVELRNTAIKAVEANIINLSQDQRTFSWSSNGKKLVTVPFEENPYSAFAAYLKTDEGVEVFQSIKKKLN
jgi:hypothetical protein